MEQKQLYCTEQGHENEQYLYICINESCKEKKKLFCADCVLQSEHFQREKNNKTCLKISDLIKGKQPYFDLIKNMDNKIKEIYNSSLEQKQVKKQIDFDLIENFFNELKESIIREIEKVKKNIKNTILSQQNQDLFSFKQRIEKNYDSSLLQKTFSCVKQGQSQIEEAEKLLNEFLFSPQRNIEEKKIIEDYNSQLQKYDFSHSLSLILQQIQDLEKNLLKRASISKSWDIKFFLSPGQQDLNFDPHSNSEQFKQKENQLNLKDCAYIFNSEDQIETIHQPQTLYEFSLEYKVNKKKAQDFQIIGKSFPVMRKVRGDGNCFYRSTFYQLLEYLLSFEQMDILANWITTFKMNMKEEDIIDYILIDNQTKKKTPYVCNKQKILDYFLYNLRVMFLRKKQLSLQQPDNNTAVSQQILKEFEELYRNDKFFDFSCITVARSLVYKQLLTQREDVEVFFDEKQDLEFYKDQLRDYYKEMQSLLLLLSANAFQAQINIKNIEITQDSYQYPNDVSDKQKYKYPSLSVLFRPGHYDICYSEQFSQQFFPQTYNNNINNQYQQQQNQYQNQNQYQQQPQQNYQCCICNNSQFSQNDGYLNKNCNHFYCEYDFKQFQKQIFAVNKKNFTCPAIFPRPCNKEYENDIWHQISSQKE